MYNLFIHSSPSGTLLIQLITVGVVPRPTNLGGSRARGSEKKTKEKFVGIGSSVR